MTTDEEREELEYEALLEKRTLAGHVVVEALTELYLLCDCDEAEVGEQLYEIDRAARSNAQDIADERMRKAWSEAF